MNKKNIALLIPTLHAGGMERVMSELANYFSQKEEEVEVHLILYGKPKDNFYQLKDNIVIHKPDFDFNDKQRTISTLKRLRYLRKTILNINPISVLSFGTLWNRFVLLALLGTKTPVYVSDRGNPLKKTNKIQELLAKILYPKAAGIIAQTGIAKSIYSKNRLNRNIEVIGNPIRTIENSKFINREKVIISVGRLISSKNFDRLINIFNNIEDKNWKLIIVGGDASQEKNSFHLQQQINNLGLKERVTLAGSQNNVDNYLLRSSIFAFTSESEGFPNVIGEAMSAGLPVVSYDCIAGPSEMILDGSNGYLIPLYDDKTFKERLELLINNEEARNEMGTRAKEDIKDFSIDKIGEQFYKLLTNTL